MLLRVRDTDRTLQHEGPSTHWMTSLCHGANLQDGGLFSTSVQPRGGGGGGEGEEARD